jgi:hypothetical protein
LRPPVALKSSIDRNGDSRRVVGSAGAHQYADAASDEAAEKGGYRYLLETVAKCAAHGASPNWSARKMPSQRGDWLGVLSGRVWGRGPREKPIRHSEDKNLFVVISMQRLLAFTQLGRFLFQQPENRPPLVFNGFRIKQIAITGDVLFADKPVQIICFLFFALSAGIHSSAL